MMYSLYSIFGNNPMSYYLNFEMAILEKFFSIFIHKISNFEDIFSSEGHGKNNMPVVSTKSVFMLC